MTDYVNLVKSKLNLKVTESITVKPTELLESTDRPTNVMFFVEKTLSDLKENHNIDCVEGLNQLSSIAAQELAWRINRNLVNAMSKSANKVAFDYDSDKTVKENVEDLLTYINSFNYDFILSSLEMRPFLDESYGEPESEFSRLCVSQSKIKDGKTMYFDTLFPSHAVLLGKKEDCQYELIDPIAPDDTASRFKTVECYKINSPNSYVFIDCKSLDFLKV